MPLSPDALVVRGGTNRDPASLQEYILFGIDEGVGTVVSVYAADARDQETRSDLLRRICTEAGIPHGQVQVGVVRDLDTAGLPMRHHTADGEPDCHYHVVFPEDVPLSTVEAFIGAMGAPESNPTGGKRRR